MEGNRELAERIPTRLTAAQGRKFGLTVGIAFLIIAGIFLWRDKDTLTLVAGSIGGLLILGGLIVPTHMGPVERAWMRLAHLISKVTTPVFLAVLYLIVITPAGAIMRLAGKRPLDHGRAQQGFWVARATDGRRSDLQRQF